MLQINKKKQESFNYVLIKPQQENNFNGQGYIYLFIKSS